MDFLNVFKSPIIIALLIIAGIMAYRFQAEQNVVLPADTAVYSTAGELIIKYKHWPFFIRIYESKVQQSFTVWKKDSEKKDILNYELIGLRFHTINTVDQFGDLDANGKDNFILQRESS